MARYIIHARSHAGRVDFKEPLTIAAALEKAEVLRNAHFRHITLVNTQTGVEVTDLEELTGGGSDG